MKIDEVVRQRFQELEDKANAVRGTRKLYSFPSPGTVDRGKFHEWALGVLSILQRVFGEESVHYRSFIDKYKSFREGYETFEDCLGIFQAAKDDYEGGYLFTARALLRAEFSADILGQASELLSAGYKDPACVVAGVALESTLKELSDRKGIPHGKLETMNVELCKKDVYNMGMQKQITAWAHWRNKAAHGEWDQYNDADVNDMIRGVTRFVADYL